LVERCGIPARFAPEVLADAAASARHPDRPATDLTGLDFVTLDPEGSKDLDQAFYLERTGHGYRVWYAIADVAAYVHAGRPVDLQAWARGTTVYSPVARYPLYPPVLTESAASLLADGVPRPAAVWRVDLDADGAVTAAHVERAMVRSRAQLTYTGVQHLFDTGRADPALALLETVGRLRQEQERARGGISLNLPEQAVAVSGGRWTLQFRRTLPVEDWNAQLSLLTGNVAATMMLEAGAGILRTLPPAEPDAVTHLRQIAAGLGLAWAPAGDYPAFVRSLDPADPRALAMMTACTTLFRGAGYVAFTAGPPPPPHDHAALAMPYAHVTAPLRRLVDRYGTAVCVAHAAGQDPPDWATAGLADLPGVMAAADERSASFERGVIGLVEALVLEPLVGQSVTGTVVSAGPDRARLHCTDPAVQVELAVAGLGLGAPVTVRIEAVDLDQGTVRTAPAMA